MKDVQLTPQKSKEDCCKQSYANKLDNIKKKNQYIPRNKQPGKIESLGNRKSEQTHYY